MRADSTSLVFWSAGTVDNQRPWLDERLAEAFAVVREACKWVLGMRHFDVQLGGGMVPNEGKTLVATVPSFHNALMGRGVHVLT